MLQIVLLAGKFAFLVILYLFIFWVVRSTTRELRASAGAPARQAWVTEGGTIAARGRGSHLEERVVEEPLATFLRPRRTSQPPKTFPAFPTCRRSLAGLWGNNWSMAPGPCAGMGPLFVWEAECPTRRIMRVELN